MNLLRVVLFLKYINNNINWTVFSIHMYTWNVLGILTYTWHSAVCFICIIWFGLYIVLWSMYYYAYYIEDRIKTCLLLGEWRNVLQYYSTVVYFPSLCVDIEEF